MDSQLIDQLVATLANLRMNVEQVADGAGDLPHRERTRLAGEFGRVASVLFLTAGTLARAAFKIEPRSNRSVC